MLYDVVPNQPSFSPGPYKVQVWEAGARAWRSVSPGGWRGRQLWLSNQDPEDSHVAGGSFVDRPQSYDLKSPSAALQESAVDEGARLSMA
jgi:hypothetical protein